MSPVVPIIGLPTVAICLPSNCSEDEIETVLHSSKQLVNFQLKSVHCQTEDDVNEPLRPEAVVAM